MHGGIAEMKSTASDPHGQPWRCYVCQNIVIIQSSFFGDATCAKCGSLIWPRPPHDQSSLRTRNRLQRNGARFGIDVENQAWRIDFTKSGIKDSTLSDLRSLGPFSELYPGDCAISDRGISNFAELTMIEVLELTNTDITDRSLIILKNLSKLEMLALDETRITDASLNSLNHFPRLWSLDLDGTLIKEISLLERRFLCNLESLSLSNTEVDDRALSHLHVATQLEELWVKGACVSATGVRKLRKSLPSCTIHAD